MIFNHLTVFTISALLLFSGVFVSPSLSAEPIKIGAPLPLTGDYAADGEHMLMGFEMAVDDLNASGGLLGQKVELVTFDTKNKIRNGDRHEQTKSYRIISGSSIWTGP